MKLETLRVLLNLMVNGALMAELAGLASILLLFPSLALWWVLLTVAGVLLAAALLLCLLFWRCPHCHRLLGFRFDAQRLCLHCGGRLDEDALVSLPKRRYKTTMPGASAPGSFCFISRRSHTSRWHRPPRRHTQYHKPCSRGWSWRHNVPDLPPKHPRQPVRSSSFVQ